MACAEFIFRRRALRSREANICPSLIQRKEAVLTHAFFLYLLDATTKLKFYPEEDRKCTNKVLSPFQRAASTDKKLENEQLEVKRNSVKHFVKPLKLNTIPRRCIANYFVLVFVFRQEKIIFLRFPRLRT